MVYLVETSRQKAGDKGFDCRWGPWKPSSDPILLSAFSSPGSTQPVTQMNKKDFSWGKMRPERRADNSAVLFVPNVRIRMKAQH